MTWTKLVVILACVFSLLDTTSGSVPSAPRNVTVDEIGSRSINISWTRPAHDGNSSLLNYAVFYKATRKNVLQLVEIEIITKATLTVKPYREYDIFVMALNNDGYGPPAVIKSGLTSEEEPGACPIAKDMYIETNGNNLSIIVFPIPKEEQNGNITHYIFFFKSRSMTEFINVTVNAKKYNPKGEVYDLPNMAYAESYGIKVVAVNSAGMCKGWKSLPLHYKYGTPSTKPPPSTTAAPVPTATAIVAPTTTSSVEKPTTPPSTKPLPSTTAAAPVPTATAIVAPITTPLVEKSTSEPTEKPKPSTDHPTEAPSVVGNLARTAVSSWLIYVLIALAVIVAIMGVTIFLLIWQLYKNHRFYKLRKEQYGMTRNVTPKMGTDNEAQDNAV